MTTDELLIKLEEQHPYPDVVFIEPTTEQWDKFHKVLEDAGFSSAPFIGHACRIGYDACMYKIEKFKP